MGSELTTLTPEYRQWLAELKARYRQVQLKAAVAVNTAMLQFYWELGTDMVAKQTQFAWGSGFLRQLSADLVRVSPRSRGFPNAIWSRYGAGTASGMPHQQLRSSLLRN